MIFLFGACQTLASLPPDELLQAQTPEEFMTIQEELNKKSKTNVHKTPRRLGGHGLEHSKPIVADLFGGEPGFYHGVASGDPLVDRVVLWTRYTPLTSGDPVELELRVAEVDPNIPLESHLDPKLNANIKLAKITTGTDSDYVAKLDVVGLKSNTHYVFAFTDGKTSSEVGQTRTAPSMEDGVEEMTYAFFSCSHFSNGYFHSYDVASTITNIDFWIHLGDYIYEYGDYIGYASDLLKRKNITLPSWEIVELQDYRNRFATYHQWDEGLRNMRRRAPVIQIWDDHELTNNAYGEDSASAGAENHQEECAANRTSSNDAKDEAQCDRDEGNAAQRFNEAAQAYMEWMPIRQGPKMAGVVNITSITQVIEWGNLASIVAVDTRITGRSKEPTLDNTFSPFAAAAFSAFNISAYYDKESEVRKSIDTIAESTKKEMSNPNYTMIGEENRNLILDTFEKSKADGKPWQIFAAAVVMGPQIAINIDKMSDYAPADLAPTVKAFTDGVLANPASFVLRIGVAMDVSNTSYSPDSFNGFAHETNMLLEGFAEKANNPIVLSGDSHDSWAYTVYENATVEEGKPVAVNLGCPGVTSPGWGGFLGDVLSALTPLLEGKMTAHKLASDTFVGRNSGLKYNEILRKGFVAVKATKTKHIAEYILFDGNTTLSDYDEARNASGSITAAHTCDISLVTTAGKPGSLEPNNECVIKYDSSRPLVWGIPVPISEDGSLTNQKNLTNCGYNACVFNTTRVTTQASSGVVQRSIGFFALIVSVMSVMFLV